MIVIKLVMILKFFKIIKNKLKIKMVKLISKLIMLKKILKIIKKLMILLKIYKIKLII